MLGAVRVDHDEPLAAGDDVVIGDDVSLGVDDESGAGPRRRQIVGARSGQGGQLQVDDRDPPGQLPGRHRPGPAAAGRWPGCRRPAPGWTLVVARPRRAAPGSSAAEARCRAAPLAALPASSRSDGSHPLSLATGRPNRSSPRGCTTGSLGEVMMPGGLLLFTTDSASAQTHCCARVAVSGITSAGARQFPSACGQPRQIVAGDDGDPRPARLDAPTTSTAVQPRAAPARCRPRSRGSCPAR